MTGKLGPERAGHSSKVTQWEAETQTPPHPHLVTYVSVESRAPGKEGKRKGSLCPQESRSVRRGNHQQGQDRPRVSWVYVLQFSASFWGSVRMTRSLSQVWQHLCVGRWKGRSLCSRSTRSTWGPGPQRHRAAKAPFLSSAPPLGARRGSASALLPLLLALALFFPPRCQVGLNYRSFHRKASAAGPLVGRAS